MPQEPQPSNEIEAPKPRRISRRRSFDTFYLFCAILLFLAIGTQIVAIVVYR